MGGAVWDYESLRYAGLTCLGMGMAVWSETRSGRLLCVFFSWVLCKHLFWRESGIKRGEISGGLVCSRQFSLSLFLCSVLTVSVFQRSGRSEGAVRSRVPLGLCLLFVKPIVATFGLSKQGSWHLLFYPCLTFSTHSTALTHTTFGFLACISLLSCPTVRSRYPRAIATSGNGAASHPHPLRSPM